MDKIIKIIFPLNMNMKRDAVADLHAALAFLKLEVAKEEIHDKRYGEETATAVRRFQANNGVRETGKVDEETAHVLNQMLHDAGSLDDLDSYAVRGQVTNKSEAPVPGLLVRAVDKDPSGENPLGQPVVTDEDGRCTIIYYDHQFRIGGRESGNADIVVRVFDPDNAEKPLGESKLHRNVPRNITIDLTVEYEPSQQPRDGDYDKFVVKGWVRSAGGAPAVDLRVTAFDVRLRQESPLGEDHTRQDGRYEIVYTRKQFADVEKSAADLRIRAYDSKGGELAFSDIVYGAGEVKTINLTLDNAAYRGPSEYEQLVTLLEPRLRGLRFSELGEDDKHQDVSFISGNTGADPRQVALLIAANRLSVRTAIPVELYYGLFRNDLSVDLPSLMIQDPDVLRRALERAVADNIIPDRFGDEIDELPARFKELVVEHKERGQVLYA
jgi:5-hydroxyisourate hydrolase-like protein (transthyretin family)